MLVHLKPTPMRILPQVKRPLATFMISLHHKVPILQAPMQMWPQPAQELPQ